MKHKKMVQIHSKKIGAIFRLLQISIIVYIVVWVMWKERGYQAVDNAVSGVTAKLKGVSHINFSKVLTSSNNWPQPEMGDQWIFDAADYVVPPQQNSAFFITTNMIVTPEQSQGVCDESADVFKATCQNDSDCTAGELNMLGSGVRTGLCVNSTQEKNIKVCQVYGWCPTEHDKLPMKNEALITNAPNFTVLLKNSIEFPRYKVKRRNVLPGMRKKFLYTCNFDPDHPDKKYCPIMRLGDILRFANADTPSLWTKGGMVSINIKWECNLDYSEDYCKPEYSFRRLDDANAPLAKGWNFRYAYKYMANGKVHRTLIKAYGIQFFITVYGKAYKFDWYTLTMNIGSGIGLLGIATIVCDMIILNIMRNRGVYRDAKVDLVAKQKDRCSPSMDHKASLTILDEKDNNNHCNETTYT